MRTRNPGGGHAAKRLLRRALMKPAPLHIPVQETTFAAARQVGESASPRLNVPRREDLSSPRRPADQIRAVPLMTAARLSDLASPGCKATSKLAAALRTAVHSFVRRSPRSEKLCVRLRHPHRLAGSPVMNEGSFNSPGVSHRELRLDLPFLPDNTALGVLPPKCPELTPAENVWQTVCSLPKRRWLVPRYTTNEGCAGWTGVEPHAEGTSACTRIAQSLSVWMLPS